MKNLNLKAFAGLFLTLLGMGALLFIPAGTLNYWQAWVLLAVFGTLGLVITVYLMIKDPQLLERRLRGGPTAEKEPRQKLIMSLASIGFVTILVVSALDHRKHWSTVPLAIEIGGDVLIVLGWLIIFFVFKVNPFTAATIEVAPNQKVITTGPYAVVRHPMYAGSTLYMLSMPLALGSWWGLLVFVLMLPVLLWRLLDEERLLKKNLPGYAEYCQKVRFRLIPYVW